VGRRVGLDGYGNSRPPYGIRSPDHPNLNKSLYRLRYPGTQKNKVLRTNTFATQGKGKVNADSARHEHLSAAELKKRG